MSIAFNAATHGGRGSGSSADLVVAHTCTGSDIVLVVFAKCYQQDRVTGVTYNGTPMTLVQKRQDNASNNSWGYTFILANPSTGTNNITLSLSSAPNSGIALGGVSYTGCATSGAPDSNDSASITTTAVNMTTTTVADNSWLVGAYMGARLYTVGSGTTERFRNTLADQLVGVDSNGAKTPAGSHTLLGSQSTGTIAQWQIVSLAPVGLATTDNAIFAFGGF